MWQYNYNYLSHADHKYNYSDHLEHHGILGQKWGVRRFQNPDGTLTEEGVKRYKEYNKRLDKIQEKITKYENKYLDNKNKKITIIPNITNAALAMSHQRDYDKVLKEAQKFLNSKRFKEYDTKLSSYDYEKIGEQLLGKYKIEKIKKDISDEQKRNSEISKNVNDIIKRQAVMNRQMQMNMQNQINMRMLNIY